MHMLAPTHDTSPDLTGTMLRLPPIDRGSAGRIMLRFIGHLPFFKFASALILPAGLNLAGAAAIALSYSVFCCEIAGWLEARQAGPAPSFRSAETPLLGSLTLVINMALCTPIWTLALSPASFGRYLEDPLALWPAFLGLIAPSCFCFAACQLHTRAHVPIARRLGLRSISASAPDNGKKSP